MGPPQLWTVPDGAFARWKRTLLDAGAPEAQVKDPVILDPERWDELVRQP